jgi:AcrR family transcriptional regulator
MTQPARRRGRPRNPAVDQAALGVTLRLLDEHGYAALRVDEVAEQAGIGLGALYRRWATKRDLVLAALTAAMTDIDLAPSDDAVADLIDALAAISTGLTGHGGRLLAVLFADSDPELADAVRQAKVIPARTAVRERLRRVIGDVPDLATRADIGPGLTLMHALTHTRPLTRAQIRRRVIPLMTGTRPSGP